MKRSFPVIIFLLFLVKLVNAQTSVTIVGTSHERTEHLNVDSITKLLIRIHPDVILQELDTALMDDQGNYKGRAIDNQGNERLASLKYRQLNDEVIFRRFDIEGRSAYYASHNTFEMENKLSNAIDRAYKNNLLSPGDREIITSFYQVNDELNRLYLMDIKTLNSKLYRQTAAIRQDMLYNKELTVLANTPQLKQYYDFQKDDGDFWTIRNHAMIDNITVYIQTFKGKRIVVLTGAMHTYFLTDGLTPLQHKFHFKLEDFPE